VTFDTDYCATCGNALAPHPVAGRIACCPEGAQYWSPHEPAPADRRGFYQLTGESMPPPQQSWVDGYGVEHIHDQLFLYRSVSGGMT
jgi:hypothetical protein